MHAYKHVQNAFAAGFADASSIAIGTLEHYRKGEGDRVDPNEGISHLYQRRPRVITGRPTQSELNTMRLFGVDVRGASDINFHDNAVIISQPRRYIFCCSTRPDFTRPDETVFVIKDLYHFARHMRRAHPEILGPFAINDVTYQTKSGDPFEDQIPAGPFFKDPPFRFENERRIVWEAIGAHPGWLTVSTPKCQDLIMEAKLPRI
jgi:hypothetical protein